MKRIVYLLLVCAVSVSLLSCAKPVVPMTANEYLSLGEKYLLDLDYEQALVQFLKVIEIEPIIPRGYTGAAESYVGLGDKDSAVAILKQGALVIEGNTEIQAMLDELQIQEDEAQAREQETSSAPAPAPVPAPTPVPEPPIESESAPDPESEALLQLQLLLRDLLGQYETGGYESIYAAAETSEYQALVEQLHTYPVIYIDETGGYGIGLYDIGTARLFIYVGGYVDLLRSGYGFWIMVSGHMDDNQYRFEGEWADDKPNGEGIEYTLRQGFDSIDSGVLLDGLWDGNVIHRSTSVLQEYHTYIYSRGKRVLIGEPFMHEGALLYPIGYIENNESLYVSVNEAAMGRIAGVRGFTESQ